MEKQNTLEWLVWTGAGVSILGLAGLIYCIILVKRAKSAGLDDAAMRATLQSVIPINLGALFLSFIGLMMVMLGIFLG